MSFYITCPDCGANLDPGEQCDCKKEPPSVGTGKAAGGVPEGVARKHVVWG